MSISQVSQQPFSSDGWKSRARVRLESSAFDYVESGAGSEDTLNANRQAFQKWHLVPRMLQDVKQRNLATSILNTPLPASFLLAPIGMQGILHPNGELATAQAATSMGIPWITSTVSSHSLESIAQVLGTASRWFQIYWTQDEEVTFSMAQRAKASGYSALVITVDTPMLGYRTRDLNNEYSPFRSGKGVANFFGDPVFRSRLNRSPEEDFQGALKHLLDIFYQPALTWEHIHRLRNHVSLPILMKGILHPEDARLALAHNLDGIIVSNHGGRQLDGCIATLDALPEVIKVTQGKIPVLLDSGIRNGTDILKARALGADAVLLGRPAAYALAAGGEEGVGLLLKRLIQDIDTSLALCGVDDINQLNPSLLYRNC
ncbi:alpha-hydroxy-acid oxidizing protein [Kroppenstedtia pulmonis]|uniref:L-lactate oxidase n=1 Tax=Kroppenstedtia pulmonis TaxID=1380685 RepID=A0A7D4B1Y2_9BACL|nr:alpha-hydroxy-acid oxidizing protein [Kroppenstedtia pulmonis]QKG83966.1 alpha-hydroxy-acid oxidizing protein [Kroppenstedtia pulmonis]